MSWNQVPVGAKRQLSLGEPEVPYMDCLLWGVSVPPTPVVVQGSPINSFSCHNSHLKKVLLLSLCHQRQNVRQNEYEKLASNHMAGKGEARIQIQEARLPNLGLRCFRCFQCSQLALDNAWWWSCQWGFSSSPHLCNIHPFTTCSLKSSHTWAFRKCFLGVRRVRWR